MSAWHRAVAVAAGLLLSVAGADAGERYGLGRPATPEEIAGWDIDVRPDGAGLPAGRGSAVEGDTIYAERCAACHGEFGEAFGRYPELIGGEGTLATGNPVKTIGSYWPYATTLWDYIYRAMPFGDAQSLSADETYAVTAFLLWSNGLVAEDDVLDQANLAAVEMPNRDGFLLPDPRPDTDRGEPCMTDCAGEATIIGRATAIDVTPEDPLE